MKYNFMQLFGNCACIGYLGKDRYKGPVDNVIGINSHLIKLLLENRYYTDFIKAKYSKTPHKPFFKNDYEYYSNYYCVRIVHENPDTEKYRQILKERCENFNSFYKKVISEDNYYFTITLNESMIDKKQNTLKGNCLIDVINMIKKYNLSDKVIFVGTIALDSTNVWNYHSDEATKLLKENSLKYIEIKNLNIWDTEESQKQFITEVYKLLERK